MRLLNTKNNLRVDGRLGERGKWVMSIDGGNCWDKHLEFYASDKPQKSTPKTKSTLYTLYVSKFDNKIYLKKKKENVNKGKKRIQRQ